MCVCVCVCVWLGGHIHFDNIVSQIFPSELQSNTSDTKASFLNLHLSISNDIISTKLYDKRDDFDMVMLLVLHLMEFIFLNSFFLLEHLAMLQTSIRVILVPLDMFKPSSKYFTDRSNAVLLLLFVFHVCLCCAVWFVPCGLVVTC